MGSLTTCQHYLVESASVYYNPFNPFSYSIIKRMDQSRQESQITNPLEPHVLIFALPFQGPLNYALKLAELICLSGIHVTFLNTDHIHRPLLLHSQVVSRFNRYPNFRFQTIPDGLDYENPVARNGFEEVMAAVDSVTKPLFREMMISGSLSRRSERPVTVMIPDAFLSFPVEVAVETSTPVICFDTISPCCLWTSYFNLPALVEAGHVPVKETDLDQLVNNVPGTEHFLRKRDLAFYCRINDLSDPDFKRVLKQLETIPGAQGLILNTFEDLDALVLPHMRKLCPNIYSIGPVHALHKARIPFVRTPKSPDNISSNSVWKEDRICLSWLDKHPPKTVVYVSFGSLATMTVDQLLEIWHGLVNSGKPFLWARRPGLIIGGYDESLIPIKLLQGTKEMGCIVDWAPQEDVLAHPAVGGFLTHCGWNSTIESISQGVPMICWPFDIDQQPNSRFVGEVWKVGVDIKDTCDRLIVEKAVRDLMDMRGDIFKRATSTWANMAKDSISETGSSSMSLARLINDIRDMSSTMK